MQITESKNFDFPSAYERDGVTVTILGVENKVQYVVRKEKILEPDFCPEPLVMSVAYTPDGMLIGEEETAANLAHLGIKPELIPGWNHCSIGFCEKEQRWYGWSRGFCGFGIGSTVQEGDVAYLASTEEDWVQQCIRFWTDEEHELVKTEWGKEDGLRADVLETNPFSHSVKTECGKEDEVRVLIVVTRLLVDMPNPTMVKGTELGHVCYPPEVFGRGAWTAETLEDAKQMAIDYAKGGA